MRRKAIQTSGIQMATDTSKGSQIGLIILIPAQFRQIWWDIDVSTLWQPKQIKRQLSRKTDGLWLAKISGANDLYHPDFMQKLVLSLLFNLLPISGRDIGHIGRYRMFVDRPDSRAQEIRHGLRRRDWWLLSAILILISFAPRRRRRRRWIPASTAPVLKSVPKPITRFRMTHLSEIVAVRHEMRNRNATSRRWGISWSCRGLTDRD